jgi:DNA-binding MarR family transcriptional regulator
VQAQTMGRTLRRLETRGHVIRARSTGDGRAQLVSLTDAGAQALEWGVESEREILAPISIDSGIFRQELQTLVRELADR